MELFDYVSYEDSDEEEFNEICEHEEQHVTRFTQSNGVEVARVQCKICGRGLVNKKKADYDFENLPLFDDELRKAWNEQCRVAREARWERRRRHWEDLEQIRESERQEKSERWWRDYNQYLRSTDWRRMQQLVLQRDNHLCQACLRNKATHVHHLSYELYNKVGRSAAFELVAICRACHGQIHPHMSDIQDDVAYHSPHLQMAKEVLAEMEDLGL